MGGLLPLTDVAWIGNRQSKKAAFLLYLGGRRFCCLTYGWVPSLRAMVLAFPFSLTINATTAGSSGGNSFTVTSSIAW